MLRNNDYTKIPKVTPRRRRGMQLSSRIMACSIIPISHGISNTHCQETVDNRTGTEGVE
jgi:hypothetical protein